MKTFPLVASILLLTSCGNTQQLTTEKGKNDAQVQKPALTASGILSQTGFVVPLEYTKLYEDKETGVKFSFPASLYLTETKQSGGSMISETGAVQDGELIHQLTLTGNLDNSRISLTLPDDTSTIGGAPHVGISENQISFHGNTIEKELSWVTQDGTGSNDEGNWEITYRLGGNYIQVTQGDMLYGSGYMDSISEKTEEIAKNILIQLVGK